MAVVIETTVGDITVDLFTERRPQTCKNFLKLCKLKYYNFCLFHSIQANFIAQTGDPTGIGTGGESVFGVVYGNNSKYYEAEKVPKIKHDKAGLLSMVNCGNNMLGSQFFVTLSDDLQSLEEHCVFAEVTEGHEILVKLNDAICDNLYRPYQDIRITHTVILDDPFEDIPGMIVPIRSPDVPKIHASNGRIGADEKINDLEGLTETQLNDLKAEREAKARATILEIVGDLPHADVAPPENVLFVCKLNPVTTDDDLEIIFSRFGKIKSCEVIRDHQSGDSLQYAFIEFEDQKACEQAYLKMDNVLIDDRRIHVDFSQSVSKIKWRGKGRGVQYIDTKDDDKESSHYSDRYVSKRDTTRDKDGRDNRDRNDRRRDDDRSRRRTERESEDRRRRDRRKEEPRRRDEDTWRESERYEEERKRREQLREERRRDEERRYTRREERRREEERRRDLEKKRSNGSDRKHKETSRRSETQVDSKKDPKDDPRVTENNRVRPADIKRENSATSVKVAKPVEVPLKNIMSQPEPEPSKPLKKDPQIKEEAINNVSSSSNDTPKMNHAAVAENDASDSVSLDKVDSMSVKVPDEKDRKKKKRKRTSTSSASSSSDSSASTTSSSSVDRKKKSKRSLTVAKKYYHRGKLVKVVKKKKRKSSDSESLTESSDSDRKKKKSKYSRKVVKVIKKKRRHSSDDTDSDSSSSDDSDSSRYSRRRRKKHDRNNKKKRKDSGRKAKKKKGQNSSDESSGSEDGNDTRKK